MKTYCRILLCLLLQLAVGYACSDNDSAEPQLIISAEEIAFKTVGGTKTMHIRTNQQWKVSSSETWCTVAPASGEGTGTNKFEVVATENTTNDIRTAIITVTAGSLSKQIKVNQALKDLLVVKKDKYEVSAEGEDIVVEFQVTGQYTVNVKADWISEVQTKAISDTQKTFKIKPNNAYATREGTIEITLRNITETVKVNQSGISLNIPSDKTGMNSDALVLAPKMKVGWNLGNSLEACNATSANETMWGNPKTTKQLIDGVKAAGFKTVRIPCAWSGYIVNHETYKIDDAWLSRVKEVVDYCVENDMYAIVNIHWDGGWRDENPVKDKQEEINKKHKALWEQIAVYFRDYDEHLLFAGTNEITSSSENPTAENIEVQLSFNQVFVNAVRSTGGHNAWRNLIVQAYNTNINQAVQYLKMPIDPTPDRLMVEVHYYDPWEFCLKEDGYTYLWGSEFAGNPNAATLGMEDWVDEQFLKMKTNFVDKGYPVIMGEYGAHLRTDLPEIPQQNHIKSRNNYLNYVTKSALAYGLVPIYWDNGNTGHYGFGLFDRSNGNQAHSDAIQAIVSAAQ